MSNQYWKKRQLESEQRAQSIASKLLEKEKRSYERIYNQLNKEINSLYVKVKSGSKITRTDLWRYGKQAQLRLMLQEEFTNLADHQDKVVGDTLRRVYEETLETELELLTGNKPIFNEVHRLSMEAHINEVYKGSNYSARLYKNANAIASRIALDMERLLSVGATPDDLMKQLQKDFNMGYNQSSTLVRTEASRVYNKAAAEGFKQAGVKQVEYDASLEACPICKQHDGHLFELGQEPLLPVHPRCRCFYIPIIEID